MKIEDLEKVNNIKRNIDKITTFISLYDQSPKDLTIKSCYFSFLVIEGQEHEIIIALDKIKSNLIEQLKELGVEVDC